MIEKNKEIGKKEKYDNEPVLWDFYTQEDDIHFDRREMTFTDAEIYAKDFNLRFEEADPNDVDDEYLDDETIEKFDKEEKPKPKKEYKKMKAWKFDLYLILGFIIGWFILGLLVSAIIIILVYFLFREQVDYSKKDKKSKKKK